MERSGLLEQFKEEVGKCMLLEEEEKRYWLESAETLPVTLLDDMYVFFKEKNDAVGEYVSKAIEADPNVVSELKEKVQTLKKHIMKFREAEEQGEEKAEEMLEEAMKNL